MSGFPSRPAVAGILLALLCLTPVAAVASPPRFAVVVGNNRGHQRQAMLRYATQDAQRVASLLDEIGGFAKERIFLRLNDSAASLRAALDAIDQQIEHLPADQRQQSLLLVYFSGHADGINLELGNDTFPFASLRERLSASPAKVKLAFIDSCYSGRITSSKGGEPGPEFEISLANTLDTNGTAIITSSSGPERSQESAAIEGSFFTHYLLAGMRGAADRNQDARVTLSETYAYAYAKTVVETARTLAGAQHPSYDYQLSGCGEVVLTDLSQAAAVMVFGPATSGTFLVLNAGTNGLVTEVSKTTGNTRRIALPAGDYLVAHRRNGTLFAQALRVAAAAPGQVRPEAMRPEPSLHAALKGGATQRSGTALFAQYGLASGVLQDFGVLHQGALAARIDLGPVTLLPRIAYGESNVQVQQLFFDYRLQLFSADAGLAWRIEYSVLDLFAGLNVGLSYGLQHLDNNREFRGTILEAGLLAGLDLPIGDHLIVQLFWHAGGNFFRLGDDWSRQLTMRGMVGAGYPF